MRGGRKDASKFLDYPTMYHPPKKMPENRLAQIDASWARAVLQARIKG